jgi:subtilisin family serine protease
MKYLVQIDTDKLDSTKKELSKLGKLGKSQALHEFVIVTTDVSKDTLTSIDGVLLVELDAEEEPEDNWFIGTVSEPLEKPTKTGEGVNVYIMDSGVRTTHKEFGGRVTTIYSTDGKEYGEGVKTPNHGTMCASTAIGETVGIAPKARMYSARYNWTLFENIKALDTILKHFIDNGKQRSILNLSLSSPSNIYMHTVPKLLEAGIVVVAAAGNYQQSFASFPAALDNVVGVGALDKDMKLAWYSNYGDKVDVYAPGHNGNAADYQADDAMSLSSGTSAAAPVVTGCLALYMEDRPAPQNLDDVLAIVDGYLSECSTGKVDFSDKQKEASPTNLTATAMVSDYVVPVVEEPEKKSEVDKRLVIAGFVLALLGVLAWVG